MNILVPVKAVPSISGGLDGEQKTTELIINPADLTALEEALLCKSSAGARVTVVSMGIPRCEQLLKECIARGADDAVLLTDRAFAGSDTCATSRILARVPELLGPFDLIFCGRKSTDGETGQVGPELAVRLQMPYVSNCIGLSLTENFILCSCLTDSGQEELRLPMPALITFRNGINSPRLPSLMGLRRAAHAQVRILNADDIGLPPSLTGQAGSPTLVRRSFRKEFRKRQAVLLTSDHMDAAMECIRTNLQ